LALQAHNTPYDEISLIQGGAPVFTSPLPLTDAAGAPKYYGVVDSRVLIDKQSRVVGRALSAQGNCTVPITGLDSAADGKVEHYGPDQTTTISVSPAAQTVVLPTPLPW
jgi:hypothetical protein